MTKPAILFLILFLPVVLIAQNTLVEPVRPIVLRNVNLIDMRSDSVSPKMTILVSGGRVVKIGKSVKAPKDAQIVDATGKFLIPGLWDNYTFTLEAEKHGAPFFELLLAHGVTGVRDVGTSMDLVDAAKLRADINAGRVIGGKKQKKTPWVQVLAHVIKAFNAWHHHEAMKTVSVRVDEEFPKFADATEEAVAA